MGKFFGYLAAFALVFLAIININVNNSNAYSTALTNVTLKENHTKETVHNRWKSEDVKDYVKNVRHQRYN